MRQRRLAATGRTSLHRSSARITVCLVAAMLVACASIVDPPSAPPTPTPDPAADGFASFLYRASTTELDAQQLPVSQTLMVVDGTGAIHWQTTVPMDLNLPGTGIVFVSGPVAGNVAWGTTDGVTETVHVASVATGAERTFALGPIPLRDAILDRSGGSFLAIIGSFERPELVRIGLEGGEPEPIATLEARPKVEGSSEVWFNSLESTPDGTRIVDLACDVVSRCSYTVIDLATGVATALTPDNSGPIQSLGDTVMVTVVPDGCVGMCSYLTVDLESGEAREFDGDGGTWDPQVAKTEAGADVLIFTTLALGEGGATRMMLRDLETGAERVLVEREAQDNSLLILDPWWQGLVTPPGTIITAPNGDLREGPPTLVRLRDGREFPLAPIER